MNGGSIWWHFYNEVTTKGYWLDEGGQWTETRRILSTEEAEIVADKIAANYGATRTSGQWGRQIGIEEKRDRVEYWRCPDCEGEWGR